MTAMMRFGLALDFGTARASLNRVLDDYVPLVRKAEEAGFDSVWAGENYPTGPGAFHLPSPMVVLAALARSTRLRLGTGVTLVPVWHPLKLAYDAAVLDQVSGGRLVLGVGVGNPPDWNRFGVSREEVAERMDETLEALKALWRGEPGFSGGCVRVEGGIAPLPIQEGGPPLWIGGRGVRAARRAARLGSAWYASTAYPLAEIRPQVARYRAALAETGQTTVGRVSVNRLTFVAETDQRAREQGAPYLRAVLGRYATLGELRDDAGRRPDSADIPPVVWSEEVSLLGSPRTVSDQLQRYADAGVTDVQFRVAPGDMPVELIERSIRLLGAEVVPHFR
jgi:alkanesulfonate monooxygenase SsuD/methylene tetrahydromethanopterin reductase-like flavin-dependent oxidoreductase (luciferase family)